MKFFTIFIFLISLSSCSQKVTYSTNSGNEVIINHRPLAGRWDLKRVENEIFQTFLTSPDSLYFNSHQSLNRFDKVGRKTGFWIEEQNERLTFCKYKNGKLHGRWLQFYEGKNSLMDGQYQHGKKTGWFIWTVAGSNCKYYWYIFDKLVAEKRGVCGGCISF